MVEHVDVTLDNEWSAVAYSNDHLKMNVAVMQHASGQNIHPSADITECIMSAFADAGVFDGRPYPMSLVSMPTNEHSRN